MKNSFPTRSQIHGFVTQRLYLQCLPGRILARGVTTIPYHTMLQAEIRAIIADRSVHCACAVWAAAHGFWLGFGSSRASPLDSCLQMKIEKNHASLTSSRW
eukprot:4205004-Pleurochrysis_carterae.AAC.2